MAEASCVGQCPIAGKTMSIESTIGNTPLIEIKKLNQSSHGRVFVKLEFLNPSGSIKDRIVRYMLDKFEKDGTLKPGGTIVENSSGNTAAAVAMLSAVRGYKAILVVPHQCSVEKVNAITAFGAQVVVAEKGAQPHTPGHYETVAVRLSEEIEGAVRLDQYNNPLNVEAHYSSTGPEIWQQSKGEVDIFVAGASTGGTISGVGKYLKEQSEGAVKVIVADVAGSSIKNRVEKGVDDPLPGKTQVEGIGKNYQVGCTVLPTIDSGLVVTDRDAFLTARRMAAEEGIMCGLSSGANVWAALKLAEDAKEPTTIVTILPDGGAKYFSKLFCPEWLVQRGIVTEAEAKKMAGAFHVGQGVTVDQLKDVLQ